MKKITALFLIAAMCLVFVACGEKALTKDEMLAIAEEYSATDIQNDSVNNLASAKQKYCSKTILLSGTIKNIKENHIELSASFGVDNVVDVYLSTDELANLQLGQSIKIVGTTTDEIIGEEVDIAGTTFNVNHYQMPSAYLVQDRFEFTGILKGINNSYEGAWNIKIGDSNYLRLIYFAEGEDLSAYNESYYNSGEEIKFSAKSIYQNSSWKYYDAKIIE